MLWAFEDFLGMIRKYSLRNITYISIIFPIRKNMSIYSIFPSINIHLWIGNVQKSIFATILMFYLGESLITYLHNKYKYLLIFSYPLAGTDYDFDLISTSFGIFVPGGSWLYWWIGKQICNYQAKGDLIWDEVIIWWVPYLLYLV